VTSKKFISFLVINIYTEVNLLFSLVLLPDVAYSGEMKYFVINVITFQSSTMHHGALNMPARYTDGTHSGKNLNFSPPSFTGQQQC